MQPLTRQELQTAVQQLRVSILGQTATKQDITRAVTAISQQSATQVDVQQILNQCTVRIVDKADQAFKQQNVVMQQIFTRLEDNSKRLVLLEDKLTKIDVSVRSAVDELERIDLRFANGLASQQAKQEAKQEAKYAQRPAFGGLF